MGGVADGTASGAVAVVDASTGTASASNHDGAVATGPAGELEVDSAGLSRTGIGAVAALGAGACNAAATGGTGIGPVASVGTTTG